MQNTQQSPCLGRNSALQFVQVYLSRQTSVGMVSVFWYPHFGHVITDCMAVKVLLLTVSFTQQVSLALVLLLAALFAGDEQLNTKMVSNKYKNFIGQYNKKLH